MEFVNSLRKGYLLGDFLKYYEGYNYLDECDASADVANVFHYNLV